MYSDYSCAGFLSVAMNARLCQRAFPRAANLRRLPVTSQWPFSFARPGAILVVLLMGAIAPSSYAQAPALLWRTNIGAMLFAVDEPTAGHFFIGFGMPLAP